MIGADSNIGQCEIRCSSMSVISFLTIGILKLPSVARRGKGGSYNQDYLSLMNMN